MSTGRKRQQRIPMRSDHIVLVCEYGLPGRQPPSSAVRATWPSLSGRWHHGFDPVANAVATLEPKGRDRGPCKSESWVCRDQPAGAHQQWLTVISSPETASGAAQPELPPRTSALPDGVEQTSCPSPRRPIAISSKPPGIRRACPPAPVATGKQEPAMNCRRRTRDSAGSTIHTTTKPKAKEQTCRAKIF